MNFLFLRGRVPTDRDPNEIVFDKLEEVDDMWTHLAYQITNKLPNGKGELWYWGGKREKKFADNFTERWVTSFYNAPDFKPDIVFCRGGFVEYETIVARFPNAIKVYYGAGHRYVPPNRKIKYHVFLQDTPQRLNISTKMFPESKSILWTKPAAENIFYPEDNIKKEFDIVFPANGAQELFKGHIFISSTAPPDLSILNLGNKGRIVLPNNVTRKRCLRSEMRENLQRAKLGIVIVDSRFDSAPRVVPELLACNIPIVVFDDIPIWKEKYITPKTGIAAPRAVFWDTVRYALKNLNSFSPREYYDNNLSMKHAVDQILGAIESVKKDSV